MLGRQTLDAAILHQAGQCPSQRGVSICHVGVTVNSIARFNRLACGSMNVTPIADLFVHVARTIVTCQTQRLPSSSNRRQSTGEIPFVIQVLSKMDLEHRAIFGNRPEVLLPMSARFSSRWAPGFLTRFRTNRYVSGSSLYS